MFIKYVKISGFKPFGETVVFGEFSPKKNCIFGLNGSGKSSFFSAIEFVFLEEFSHLRPTDRQSLLYSGKALLSSSTAYVEITFDNTAQRLPIKDSEVSIRRSIGLNKDEYFIQRRHSTRQEVMNLFDSANYSIGSGLFSVRQGRVKAIAEMTDADRMELIYEISGMRSYDEQKRESESLLIQSEKRCEKIAQAIIDIEKKLSQIYEEKTELEEYEKVTRIKKAIEYTIYEKDRESVDQKLNDNQADIENESSIVSNLQREKDEYESNRISIEEKLESVENSKKQNKQDFLTLEQKRQDLIKKKAHSEFVIEQLKQKTENAESNLAQLIEKKEKFEKMLEECKERQSQCEMQRSELNGQKVRYEALLNYSKTLQSNFDEISEIEKQIKDLSSKIDSFHHQSEDHLNTLKSSVLQAEEIKAQKKEEKEMAMKKNDDNHNEKMQKSNEKKLLFKNQFELQKRKQFQEQAYQKAISNYEHMMGETAEAINYIKKHFNEDDGYYGQLIDLIEFDEEISAAIDSVAGRRLFCAVVSTDSLAIKILDSLKKNGVFGKVNFLLLNQLKGTRKSIEKTADSQPLIDLIKFNDNVKKAVEFVFGSICLCSNIKIATEIAETCNCTCVTFDGDTAYDSGLITGGYISTKRSISRARKNIDLMLVPLENTRNELDKVDKDIEQLTNYITQIDKKISQNEKKIISIDKEVVEAESHRNENQKEIQRIEQEFEIMNNKLQELANKKEGLEEAIRIQQSESSTSLNEADRQNDQNELYEIITQLAQRRLELKQLKCNSNELTKKIESTEKQIDELQEEKLEELKEKAEKEKKDIQYAIKLFENENNEIEMKKDELKQSEIDLKEELNRTLSKEEDCKKKLYYEANRLEGLNRKKSILTSKQKEIIKSIAGIGPLPLDEIEEYKGKHYSEIIQELNEINSRLGSFRNVNKKAIEQYKQFEKQGADLKIRKEDIDNSIIPIQKLIQQLDENKEKAVTRTFSIVSENFSKIFHKLSPNKQASLILTTQNDTSGEIDGVEILPSESEIDDAKSDSNQDSEDGSNNENDSSDDHFVKRRERKKGHFLNFRGMSISVNGEKIDGLSGGEKTLVAISLLFAIQQTESSPFYLLDEVDSDLDINAREALAKMIDEMTDSVDMSKQVQFIYTTHRGELMEHADKFFAMKHANDNSTVQETNYEGATAFIADNHDEENVF